MLAVAQISIRNTEITFSIWDLGGQREFVSMLPLVCNDAVAILFMFDLSRKSTLNSIKEWYRQARGFNKVRRPRPCRTVSSLRDADLLTVRTQTAIPFLVGTKYDAYCTFSQDEQEEIARQVRLLARTLPSPACALVGHAPRPSSLYHRDRTYEPADSDRTARAGKTLLQGDEGALDLLLDEPLDQRAEDLQDRAQQGALHVSLSSLRRREPPLRPPSLMLRAVHPRCRLSISSARSPRSATSASRSSSTSTCVSAPFERLARPPSRRALTSSSSAGLTLPLARPRLSLSASAALLLRIPLSFSSRS